MVIKNIGIEKLDELYDMNGFAFLNRDFNPMLKDEGALKEFKGKMKSYNVIINEDTSIYVVPASIINERYDLEGDNKFKDDTFFSVIPYNVDAAEVTDLIELMYYITDVLEWRTIIDRRMYTEYVKGRHEKTDNIQWLIDINKDEEDDDTNDDLVFKLSPEFIGLVKRIFKYSDEDLKSIFGYTVAKELRLCKYCMDYSLREIINKLDEYDNK